MASTGRWWHLEDRVVILSFQGIVASNTLKKLKPMFRPTTPYLRLLRPTSVLAVWHLAGNLDIEKPVRFPLQPGMSCTLLFYRARTNIAESADVGCFLYFSFKFATDLFQ